jgi:hypothetical protein
MEATGSSEKLVNGYQATQRHTSYDFHLYTHHPDNLQSHHFKKSQVFWNVTLRAPPSTTLDSPAKSL